MLESKEVCKSLVVKNVLHYISIISLHHPYTECVSVLGLIFIDI